MKIDAWLRRAQQNLAAAGIGTARLDVLVLLEDCLGVDRAHILAHPEQRLSISALTQLEAQIQRRLEHEPLAYIRGKTEFYGREFAVDHRVLEPRPESEMMIDLLKKVVQADAGPGHTKPSLADVGSGSGCLGITAARELGLDTVDFIDSDPATLDVARHNAAAHHTHGNFMQADLLDGDGGPYDIILANLPYVPDGFHINQAALQEPSGAIFGGADGLDLYRRLFEQLQKKSWRPTYVFTEALPTQHPDLAGIAQHQGYALHQSEDFIQVFRPIAT